MISYCLALLRKIFRSRIRRSKKCLCFLDETVITEVRVRAGVARRCPPAQQPRAPLKGLNSVALRRQTVDINE